MLAVAVRLCECPCHRERRADWNEARQLGNYMAAMIASSDPIINANIPVVTHDVVAAALACPVCIDEHCDALSSHPPRETTPWVDPPVGQADGEVPEG